VRQSLGSILLLEGFVNQYLKGCLLASAFLTGMVSLTADALEREAVDSFFDDYLPQAMAARHVPGLAVTVVQRDRQLTSKGYGVADTGTMRPVDPDATLFDVQSVAKLVVATSAVIAAERGSVDLNADVNQYLEGFELPRTHAEPVTLAALLTHTSGLEDRGTGITTQALAEVPAIGTFLKRTLTQRVAPPFQDLVYSDQGMTLAAFAVQTAVGIPFDEYARLNVFEPLGMNHTHYLDVPEELKQHQARSYSFEDGQLVPIQHHYWNIWPSSSLWTTAKDMSRFVGLHLSGGSLDGARLLGKDASERLHTRHFSYHPEMAGVCLGFFERFENGHRLLIHSGGGSGFLSEMMLLPEEGVGYFLAYNGYDGSLISAFRSAFLDRFYPAQHEILVNTVNLDAAELDAYEGWYWSIQNDRRTIEKLTSLLDGYIEVAAVGGALLVGDRSFNPVDPTLFVNQDADEPEYIAFRRDESGEATHLLSATSEAPFQRVSWFYGQRIQLLSVVSAVLAFTLFTLYAGVALVRRRKQPFSIRWTDAYMSLLTLANLAAVLTLVASFAGLSTHSGETSIQLGIPLRLQILVGFMTILSGLSLASPVVVGVIWQQNHKRLSLRVVASFLASLAALLFVWFLATWNIIGFRY
jgi:CubicO group peptidase (beta-lactamase class C family)